MGIESANYTLFMQGLSEAEVAKCVRDAGGEVSEQPRDRCFVYRSDSYYIDLAFLVSRRETGVGIEIRIALVNPLAVGPAFHGLLSLLAEKATGIRLRNRDSKREWVGFDEFSWNEIWQDYLLRRQQFRDHFGEFDAAISGDNVFPWMRERGLRRSEQAPRDL